MKVISKEKSIIGRINSKISKYGFWHTNIEVYSEDEDWLFHTDCNNFNEL
jgi:hypothetical protein